MTEVRVDRLNKHTVAWLVLGLIVVGMLLRFWRLGDWNFQATEIFTLRDSGRPQFNNPRPLGYVLNYYLIRPFLPLDEFGLRLLPAIFGVLAIPVLYLVGRRVIGSRAALFAALLLTLSPLHIMYSQLARYWSLVFFFSAIYPSALYVGVRERNPRWLVLGIVTAILAALAHPVSSLLLAGPLLVLLPTYLRPGLLREVWERRSFRWWTIAAFIVAVLIVIRFIPILHGWIAEHDRNPGSGQFLLRRNPPGIKQLIYLLAFVDSLTVPLTFIALLGLYLLWRSGFRLLAMYLSSVAGFPILFLTLISLRTPVSQYYLLPTVPVFFLAAGFFLDWVASVEWPVRPRWIVPAAFAAIVIAAGLPTLGSDYRDGRRYDFRRVAHWLQQRLSPGDVVFSDQPMVLAHYLEGVKVQRLRLPEPLAEAMRDHPGTGKAAALWIVAPAASHAFRATLREGGLIDWIYPHCQLQNTVGVGRVDYRQEYLQVYRCPPLPLPERASSE
jgi:mannosyltransferase